MNIGSNHTISSKRLIKADGKETYSGPNLLADVQVWIEKMSLEDSQVWTGGSSLALNLMIMDGLPDIKRSDKITDEDGVEYFVYGVQPFKGGDVPSHTEVALSSKAVTI